MRQSFLTTLTSIIALHPSSNTSALQINRKMQKSNDNLPDATSPVIPEEYVTLDSYNGVLVDVRKVPIGRLLAEAVESDEKQSLARMFMKGFQVMLDGWEDEGKRGIWLTLSKEQSLLVPLLADLEFDFQFCEKGKLVMTRW